MESINGLPAHPLFIHAPVVLMPLALLLTVVLIVRPRWRATIGVALPLLAAVVLGATQLAIMSGQAFDEVVGDRIDTTDHENLALMTRNFLVAFLVASVVLTVFDWWQRREGPRWVGSMVLISLLATFVTGTLATVWMVRTGDEGARLVWDGILAAGLAAATGVG